MTRIYIGIDDTDVKGSIGTGRKARELGGYLAEKLGNTGALLGITRHQLLFDPRVPYTAKNSCAAVHLEIEPDAVNVDQLLAWGSDFLMQYYVEGSDPGICVADHIPDSVIAWGRRAQTELVRQQDARDIAEREGLPLRGLGGTEDGVIGALSAVGLAHTGEDGRYTHVGRNRELAGDQTAQALLDAGMAAVLDMAGNPLPADAIIATEGKLRPARRQGRAIVYCERHADGVRWTPLKLD